MKEAQKLENNVQITCKGTNLCHLVFFFSLVKKLVWASTLPPSPQPLTSWVGPTGTGTPAALQLPPEPISLPGSSGPAQPSP